MLMQALLIAELNIKILYPWCPVNVEEFGHCTSLLRRRNSCATCTYALVDFLMRGTHRVGTCLAGV
jgi:hypothetical protein